jgi:hypothetical protein
MARLTLILTHLKVWSIPQILRGTIDTTEFAGKKANKMKPFRSWTLLVGILPVMLGVLAISLPTGGSADQTCKACDVPEEYWENLPQEKRDVMERVKAEYDEAVSQGSGTKDRSSTKSVPPASSADHSWPEGIFETSQAPLSKAYVIQNQWQADRGGFHIRVYAGASRDNPSQGLVVVLKTSLDLQDETLSEYVVPGKTGGVRIVNVDADRLTLVSANGDVLAFDVAGRNFASATLPSWPAGIFPNIQPFPAGFPFAANVLSIANVWQAFLDGEYVRVFAGAYVADPTQGVVVVQRVPQSLWYDRPRLSRQEAVQVASGRPGGLRVTSEYAGQLTLTAKNGKQFGFDLGTNDLFSR